MQEAIPVTQKHIHDATQEQTWCPIQRALKAEYPEATAGYSNLWLDRAKVTENIFYRISEDLTVWMKRYDSTSKAEPFMLILDHKARTASMLETA